MYQSLNTTDTRRWAKTAPESSHEGVGDDPYPPHPAPTRDEERRFSQTEPVRDDEAEAPDQDPYPDSA